MVVQKKEDKIRVCLPHIDMFNKCSTYLQGRRISEFGIRVWRSFWENQAVPLNEDVFSVEEGKLDWWTMYFDGAANVCGNRADAMIISPNKK